MAEIDKDSSGSSINYSYYKSVSHLEIPYLEVSSAIRPATITKKSSNIIDPKFKKEIIEKNIRLGSAKRITVPAHDKKRSLSQEMFMIKQRLGTLFQDLQNAGSDQMKDKLNYLQEMSIKTKKKVKNIKSMIKSHEEIIHRIEAKLDEISYGESNQFQSINSSIVNSLIFNPQRSLKIALPPSQKSRKLVSLPNKNSPRLKKLK